MKQIWNLNNIKGAAPKGVVMILMRDGTTIKTETFSAGSRYSWDTALWKKHGQGCDIVAYHCEGDYKC